MSRLKRTCKGHNDIIDTENLLKNNNFYALNHKLNEYWSGYLPKLFSRDKIHVNSLYKKDG
jgi:hypothetical protein